MDQPFVLPDILKCSNYDNTLPSAVRYICYLLTHLGEHAQAVKAHFGLLLTAEELLVKIVECLPRILIHLYWFSKEHLPHLACTKNFPVQCAEAYGELMESVKAKIPDMEALYAEVCPPVPAVAPAPQAKDQATAVSSNVISSTIGSHIVANTIIVIGDRKSDDVGKTGEHR